MRRALLVFLCWTTVAAACSATGGETTTTTSPTVATSTTTTAPTTTTTTVAVEGAPADLATFIRETLEGEDVAGPPDLAAAAVAAAPEAVDVAVATLGGQHVAVATFPEAVLAAVDQDGDWSWVAGRVGSTAVWPSLPAVYAVVGSDARPGEDPLRTRADSIHLVGLAGDGSASIVGVPRDAYVAIPGQGRAKINGSLAVGGPELMMATFEAVSGLDLAGYVLTGFVGFQEMVGNVLGGFDMDVPAGFSDRASGSSFEAGTQYFNGPAALAFARARKSFDDGDFTRQLNGGMVMIAALAAVKAKGPLDVPRLLEASEAWLSSDLAPAQLLELALAAGDVDLGRVSNQVLPGRATNVGGASVVIVAAEATSMFEDLSDGHPESG